MAIVSGILLSSVLVTPLQGQETFRQFLSGRGKDDAVPWRFQCTSGAQSGYWTNLPVPSQWDMHGFGTLSYHKDATNAWDERGLYEHDFTVPSSWSGRRVFLVFEGSMTDTAAKLNGTSVGPVHQGGFYRFKYEVTPFMNWGGTNHLQVEVAKHSANDSVNRAERLADYWVFGGIYRPVYLEAVPEQFIERVAIDGRADGTFTMDVFASGATNSDTIEAQIRTLDGKPVGGAFSTPVAGARSIARPEATLPEAQSNAQRSARLATRVTTPFTWTAETPNLYRVEVRLKRGNEVLHRFNQRFGFRTMEVREGDGLYVNGRRVILRGVNRHSFWPDSGRCLSEAVQRLDIETIKDMNMNAVRMSHYPPDAEFLDLCDELGLYVLDELTGWHNHYDDEVGRRLVEEMVTRDVNHPSILFWDNGNEGGFNTNLDTVFPELDPQQRRVLHPWASFNGLCTAHYLAFDKAQIAAAGKSVYYHDGQELVASNDPVHYIYMPTEFMHGLFDGGGGAGLEDYWNMMTASRTLGGGFIWAFTDDGVKRPDTGEIDTAGNQAPDGIVGPYRQREASFYTIKQVWSPIEIVEKELGDGFDGTLTVENRFDFTDASDCTFGWQLCRSPQPGETTNAVAVQGTARAPRIAPHQRGKLKLPLPVNWQSLVATGEADYLVVRADDPTGRNLWTWSWPLARRDALKSSAIVAEAGNFGGTNHGTIELKSDHLVARIDASNGALLEVLRDGRPFSLKNGPRLAGKATAWRACSWKLRSDDWLECDFTYSAEGTNDFLGVIFDYPEPMVKHKRWFGDGPYRVWQNRAAGVRLGYWENDYNNTITGFRDWIYPEFKGCFSGIRWMQFDTAEGPITIVPKGIPYVQVLTPEQPPAKLIGKTGVPLPQAGLGFWQAIPAIGTKFKDAIMAGPQSQPFIARGEYSGSVSFYFGALP